MSGGILVKSEHGPHYVSTSAGKLQQRCNKCSGNQLLQNRSSNQVAYTSIPIAVHEMLDSSDQSLSQSIPMFTLSPLGHHFSQVSIHVPSHDGAAKVQAKLAISQPGDALEQEADRVAEQVMRMPESRVQSQPLISREETGIQRKCPKCKGDDKEVLQAKSIPDRSLAIAEGMEIPPIVREVIHLPGQELDPSTRAFFEPRFSRDFSKVRLHTDARAAESAKAMNALAYTVGRDVVFESMQYAPNSRVGLNLLSHELAHVVQQNATGQTRIDRQSEDKYETKGIPIERSKLEEFSRKTYWETKIDELFERSYDVNTSNRFSSDPEERDAVLSVLWQLHPTRLTGETTRIATIPARAGKANSKPLVYQFIFTPKKTGSIDTASVTFISEGNASAVATATSPSAGYTPGKFGTSNTDFPGGDQDRYWASQPDEHAQLDNWIENVAGNAFDQIVTTRTNVGKSKNIRETSFYVKGSKDASGRVSGLVEIYFLGVTTPITGNPPAGYADKDGIDLYLEKAQTSDHPTKKDRLGNLGLSAVPGDEVLSVKYAILAYFKQGTRSAEVDAIIPIANKQSRIYYTLRFRPAANKLINVDVERVGEPGKDQNVSPNQLDVARVRGFAANSKDSAALKAWMKKRYPGVSPTGKTVDDLQNSFNLSMNSDVGTPGWFQRNYGLNVLNGADGSNRLKSVHRLVAAQLANTKNFAPDELKSLEFSLESMDDSLISILKGTPLIRQEALIKVQNNGQPRVDSDQGGYTWQTGSDRTVVIYDSFTKNVQSLFLGGKEGVRSEDVMTIAHELGHVIGSQLGIEAAFRAFVKSKKIKPITWYDEINPAIESFPEAFAIYQTDPEWMKTNLPDLYAWFGTLSGTGKPP